MTAKQTQFSRIINVLLTAIDPFYVYDTQLHQNTQNGAAPPSSRC